MTTSTRRPVLGDASSLSAHLRDTPLCLSERVTRLAWLLLLLVVAALYLGATFAPGLLDDADATHAEAAREMAATGDWVTMHVDGVRYLEKAPLPYWAAAAWFKIFGDSSATAHFPLALSVILLVVLAGAWGGRAFGRRGGIYAALFMGTAAGVYLFTRVLIPDVLLSLLIAAALYFYLTALEAKAPAWRWYAGYACVALAVLAKGLVALVFVGATAFLYLWLSGEWRRWREFRLPTGLLLLFLVAAPWHILAGIRNHGFFWFYFVNEHFLRFLGKRYPKDYNKLPALAYWGLHLVWLFPWSFYLPVFVRNWKREFSWADRNLDFRSRTRLLCAILAAVVLVFFAFSTNQEYYTFPAYLPLLLLIAGALAEEEESLRSRRWILGGQWLLAILGLDLACVLAYGLWESRRLPFVPDIGEALVERGIGHYTLSMSHFFDLSVAAFAGLRAPAVIAGIALSIGPLVALWLRYRRRDLAATCSVAATMIAFFVAAQLALVRFEPYLSSRVVAERVAAVAKPQDHIVMFGDQAYGSSFIFYLRRPAELIDGKTTSLWFGSTFPDVPPVFIAYGDLAREWNSPQRVFLYIPDSRRELAEEKVPQPHYVVAETSGKVVWSNQPQR